MSDNQRLDILMAAGKTADQARIALFYIDDRCAKMSRGLTESIDALTAANQSTFLVFYRTFGMTAWDSAMILFNAGKLFPESFPKAAKDWPHGSLVRANHHHNTKDRPMDPGCYEALARDRRDRRLENGEKARFSIREIESMIEAAYRLGVKEGTKACALARR